ncbi:hypothetical protein [Priestia megaterium]|uniref:hypothetical protein n=1 Tax=Priestia megaterium TaxID=1404 RepID=UPI0015D49C2D|nr:hypothetical protein [Priestia megaterium]
MHKFEKHNGYSRTFKEDKLSLGMFFPPETYEGKHTRIGFDGEIGFLNWEWTGDLYSNLDRSLQAFRDMEKRLEKFLHWAELERPY